MLRIGDTIFSLDIIEKKFSCNLSQCLGNCCREGDSGAPLSDYEVQVLDEIWPALKPFLRIEGIRIIEKEGKSIKDFENEQVTPLINNRECVYTLIEDGVLVCGIEKAWASGEISFRKPLSCHLFPVRMKKFSGFTAVNYQELPLCQSARQKGSDSGIFLYEFLREPLIRALGEETYKELCMAAEQLRGNKKVK